MICFFIIMLIVLAISLFLFGIISGSPEMIIAGAWCAIMLGVILLW